MQRQAFICFEEMKFYFKKDALFKENIYLLRKTDWPDHKSWNRLAGQTTEAGTGALCPRSINSYLCLFIYFIRLFSFIRRPRQGKWL